MLTAEADREAPAFEILAPMSIEAQAVRKVVRARVRCTGMGPKRSSEAAAELASGVPGALAVAGLCGALDTDLRPGDAVVASEVRGAGAPRVCHAFDALADAVRELGLNVHRGPILSVDHVVRGRERAELRQTGALAVDMESVWLAPADEKTPFAVLRVVLDTPEHELRRLTLPMQAARALRALRAAAPALEKWASILPGVGSELKED